MVKKLLICLVIVSSGYVYAQKSDCKVIPANLSGSYSGSCKNGLAHGKGIAQGVDRYEGRFAMGKPDGNGTYTWANGTYYKGEWKNGRKDGKGIMVSKDSTVSGYWKDDKYLGEKFVPPFRIKFSRSVPRYAITKSGDIDNGVAIRIMMGGDDNLVEDFSMAYSSGDEFRLNNFYCLRNTTVPLDVKVTYTSWNQIHTATHQVIFEFTILDTGKWDVTIYN